MASSTPFRRPLATLNSNNAFSSQASRLSHTNKSPTKSVFVDKTLLSEATDENENLGRFDGKEGHYTDNDNDVRKHKRQRREGPGQESTVHQHDQQQGQEVQGALEDTEDSSHEAKIRHELEDNSTALLQLASLVSPSPEPYASSPSTQDSNPASPAAVNGSQNTTITVPDKDLTANWLANASSTALLSRPLTTEEVRQKAKEIKLRLSLANYKVLTNQINVPISRLQIRSSIYPSRITASTRLSRTPLPTFSSFEASPRKHLSIDAATNRGISTPLLPRQRQGLLNPPALDIPEEKRLSSSSAVKGHAVDGLLSLMRTCA